MTDVAPDMALTPEERARLQAAHERLAPKPVPPRLVDVVAAKLHLRAAA